MAGEANGGVTHTVTLPDAQLTDAQRLEMLEALQRADSAKREAERMTGNLFREKAWWQVMAGGLLVLSLLLGGVVIYLGRQPAFEPKYAVKNQFDQFQVVGWDQFKPEQKDIEDDLLEFMRCVRSIPNDRPVLQMCNARIALFLAKGSQAHAAVVDYRKRLKPNEVLYRRTVTLHKLKAWPDPDGRWRLTWEEEVRSLPRGGGPSRQEQPPKPGGAFLVVTRVKPKDPKAFEYQGQALNPLGLLVTHLGWQE